MTVFSSAHGLVKRLYLNFQPRAVVLMYHRVAEGVVDPFGLCVSPENFRSQLDVLTGRYSVLRLEDILTRLREGKLPSRAVAITFDDGYADNAHVAADLLRRRDTPATVFVTSGYLDGKREYWWDELVRLVFESRSDPSLWITEDPQLASAGAPGAGREEILKQLQPLLRIQAPEQLESTLSWIAGRAGLERVVRETHRPMSAAECAALAGGGLIGIGAHTIHHAWLAGLSGADQHKELRESKRALEEVTGAPVRTMAYPYGRKESVSPQTLGRVREAGFSAACANERGLVKADCDPYWIPRFIPHNVDGETFAKRMESFFGDHSPVRTPSGREVQSAGPSSTPIRGSGITKAAPTRARLAELEAFEKTVRYGIHLKPDWLARYVECFHREQSAFILEIRDPESGTLIGALPLEVQIVPNEHGLKIRQLIPLAGVQSDFGALLCAPGREAECADRIARWLADSRQDWDSLRMNILPQSSAGWSELVQALTRAGFSPTVSRDRFFYKVNTDGRWADYEKRFLHRRTDTVRNLINQFTRDSGGMKVERIERGIGEHLGELMEWYRRRRSDAAQKDAFAVYPEKLAFLKSVLADFESQGLVRLSILKAGERIAAYQLDWIDRGIWYYYMPAFHDPFARYSPSKILLYETLRTAFEEPDVHEFNFMRGEEPYKAQFADETEAYVSIRVTNPASTRTRAATIFSRILALRKRIIRKR